MATESTFTFRASEQQKRLWGFQGSGDSHAQACLALPRNLEIPALKRAASRVVERHEILRTTFHRRQGVRFPYQVVGGSGEVRWRQAEIAEIALDRLEEILREERSEPLDLSRGPVVRLALLRGAGPEPLLVITLPALCADPRSLELFVEELLGFATGGFAGHAEGQEPLQYVDFTRWQEEMLAGEDTDLAPAREYWRRLSLEGLARLSLAGGRVASGPFDPGFVPCVLEPEWTLRLEEAARQSGAGLPSFALAAWMTFLWRMGAGEGLVVGRLAAARTLEDLESCLGPIARVVPLAAPLANGLAFVDLWTAVENEIHAGDRWPELAPQPLAWPFQFEAHDPCAGEWLCRQWHGEPFELKLVISSQCGHLAAEIWYDRRLYEPAEAERLANRFAVLLRGAQRTPGRRLGELDLLTEEEYLRLVLEPNRSMPSVALTRCVHELFAEQAAHHPDRIAVVSEQGHLTAGELEERANRLANYLRRAGVGPEVRVAIFLERSCESIVAILGILKAGGAYVPLDPVFPRERVAGMLEQVQAAAVLTHERFLDALPDHPARRICLDAEAGVIARESPQAPASGAGPENLVYVLFTSGSTGRPKGVATEHRHLLHYLAGILERLADLEGTSFATVSTLAADLGNTAIFPALVRGGTLHVVSSEHASDPSTLADRFRRHPVDVLKIVPSHLSAFLQSSEEVLPRELLILGGEASGRELIEQVKAAAPGLRILNHYGPTETTVGVTTWEVPEPLPADVMRLPLGRPLPGARTYLLNPELQPVPAGVAGEVYIGGGGVARGYLDAPEQTAQRFLPDPFCRQAGQRLYRTGDLGRFRPEGDLEFLGRTDGQVKIRGFRIELGEIEAVLRRHPDVRECAVISRVRGGEAQIAAYVVPRRERKAVPADLRSHLAERLPNYMLPAAFVRLGVLPLTANGKLDRQALEQSGADLEEPEAGGPEDLPRDPVEEVLAGIWSDLLGRERLGVHENFFELGGHSLLGTRLVSRLRRVFDIELPLRALFEAPTIAAMAPRVEAARSGPRRAAPAPTPTARGLASPLSFAQERLWFFDQIEPGNPAYNIPAAVRLTGALDIAALAASLSVIIERHEVLRTTFEACDGQPVQVIQPMPDLPSRLPIIDLRALPAVEREAEAQRIALAEARRPFDLARGPLVRTVLLQLAPLAHAVLIGMHHIVSDGWSAGVLIRELQALHGALSAGRPALLPPLPIQYADFAAWQRAWLQGEVLASRLAGWRRLLASAPTRLELPTDRPRPPAQSYRGDDVPVVLAPELARALAALGRRCGATPFMVLLAAFQTLLARWSGQERVVVGSPVANRTHLEIEPLIGFFANTLALPGDLTGGPTFTVLLDRVRDATLTAHAHQDLPFERLVEELQPARSLAHSPIFQVMLAWQNTPAAPLEVPGLVLEPIQAGSGAAKFDLTLSLAGLDGSLRGALNYATALFDRTTAERMAGHLQSLLAAISAEPDAPVRHLPLLTPAEARQMAEWNATDAAFPLETTSLHALIAAQAERTPDAVAVVFEERSLSYRALEAGAARLAGRLRRLGVGPDVLVGIAAERSLELVVGLLAILKAGGAYVPLDPSYPRERLAYLLADSRVPILLTQERLLSVLPTHGAVVVLLDEQAGEESEASSMVAPDHLAYVIYTSGSTGWPKGAMNTHRGIVNRLLWMQQRFALAAGDRVLQKTPISFDVSVWELFWPLLAGATLVMARPGGHQDSAYLVDTIVEREVTALHFVPPMLHAFLETPGADQCPTLRLVLASGEALPAELVRRFYFQRGTGRASLHNLYGPTEAAVEVTHHACTPADGVSTVPIGRPVANTRIRLLDRHLEPVPAGVVGELYIGGVQLARGYLGRPGLTAERFVPDPFSGAPGARLYRSGDLARYRPDGAVEFLGRTDDQVKIRGIRIELGEVEAALRRLPAVSEAVVVARSEDPAPGSGVVDRRLVAYLVAQPDRDLSLPELEAALRKRLPEAMVPSAFVLLDALPLSPNGKVDRLALPAPHRATAPGAAISPRDDWEMRLAGIWQELLGVAEVGVTDDYFMLGGHSLAAVRLMARIERAFGVRLPVSILFSASTVERLAAQLRGISGPRPLPADPLVSLRPGGAARPLFLVHPVGGNVFCYARLARLAVDRPVYGLQSVAQAPSVAQAAAQSIEDMARCYLDSVLRTQPEDPYRLAGWSMGAVIAYEMARQLERGGRQVDSLVLIDPPRAVQPDEREEPDEGELLLALAQDLAGLAGQQWKLAAETVQAIAPAERMACLLELGRATGALPADLDPAQLADLFALFRRNFAALRGYRPGPYGGSLLLLRASASPFACTSDPSAGWDQLAAGGARLHLIEGDHYSLLKDPAVVQLADHLDERSEGTRKK